ncbi:unnamed protein product, partial [Meganyctiphanes norvegica]
MVCPLRLQNIVSQGEVFETLSAKATTTEGQCTRMACNGALMTLKKSSGQPRPREQVLKGAKEFLDAYYMFDKRFNSEEHKSRWETISSAIEERGIYELTEKELVFGAKLAWRNAPRCIGRIQWSNLQVFDARDVSTPSGMFESICNHINFSTNNGNIRSAITIFPARTNGKNDFRVWNPQLISYAGYRQKDGTCIGDPINCEFTQVCQSLGWHGNGGRWDILPLVLSANGQDPQWFEIPSDIIMRVPISHPEYKWFAEMGLEWYAVPAVSSMCFDCGGLEFPACPFNGWYMGTEIAARNFCDPHRLNILEDVSQRMGLDARNNSTLWKDKALVEVNVAVLHSFQSHNVTLVDHHTASETFMQHFKNEQRLRGGCPADWVWIVPPMSGSLTPVFHQEMSLYHLKPSFEYQDPAWKTQTWEKNNNSMENNRIIKFKQVALALMFTSILYKNALSKRTKVTILYATETGKSEIFANKLEQIFNYSFNVQVYCMDDYNHTNIVNESLVLVVTSTFGNGGPPENGKKFAKNLYAMKCSRSEASVNDAGPLSHVRYAVFALGSSAYPEFCAFGKYVDNLFGELGGEPLMALSCGDELTGQEKSFNHWVSEVFKRSCEICFIADEDDAQHLATQSFRNIACATAGSAKLQVATKADVTTIGLSHTHGKKIRACKVLVSKNVHDAKSSRCTQLVVLDTGNLFELSYQPGDHVAIIPGNQSTIVDAVLARLCGCPNPDLSIQVMVQKVTTLTETVYNWEPHGRLPSASVREMLTRYLDITTPPSTNLLNILAEFAQDNDQKSRLELLATDSYEYEEWKKWNYPNLKEVLEQFPSVSIDACVLLINLPLLQPRFYSISSSLDMHPGQIHLTVDVVEYRTQGGKGPLHQGTCSNFLKYVRPGDTVECFVRCASSFHMPSDIRVPIIMVGLGTGVAPFRSFWHQRYYDVTNRNMAAGETTLFFGCQTKSLDLYADEKEAMKRAGILNHTYLSLSREPNIPKTYVQDLMDNVGEDIYQQVVKEKGHFYFCGDNTKGKFVYQKLKSIVQIHGKLTDEEVENFMLQMRDEDRYHEDIIKITLNNEIIHKKEQEQEQQQSVICQQATSITAA